jgi:hypothetical protein
MSKRKVKEEPTVSEQDLIDDLEELMLEFDELVKENKMATAKPVNKLSDKLTKVNENFSVNRYDNGYMVEVGGRNKKGDYVNAKIVAGTIEEVLVLVNEALEMDLDV